MILFYFSQTEFWILVFLLSDLLLSSVSDRPFNLKVRVKKKFKVAPRNQSTVALIKPHYLIFIFHPATLSPSGWLIWLAARVEEPRTVTWILVTFQVLLKPFVYICWPFLWQNCTADKADSTDTHELPRIASEPADTFSYYLNEAELGQVKVVCDKPGRYD